ncbi:hypothetical protein [Scytonema sp. NUACC26]|uniref:hypothetical protein n=1 Tax=Scytonema sp. NUACC26 TaxID=3140176 RepID=UPI0038B2C5AE
MQGTRSRLWRDTLAMCKAHSERVAMLKAMPVRVIREQREFPPQRTAFHPTFRENQYL